jgi:hypothetical protein
MMTVIPAPIQHIPLPHRPESDIVFAARIDAMAPLP